MINRIQWSPTALSAGVLMVIGAAAPQVWSAEASAAQKHQLHAVPLEAATMIIEFNSSAPDVGVQFFLDSEGWKTIEISDPNGEEIFSSESAGRLSRQGGGTELFLESVEPELVDLSFAQFFHRFPAGSYTLRGRTTDGELTVGHALFSHAIPAGPEVLAPVGPKGECAVDVPIPVIVAWNPVTTSVFGDPIDIKGYEVIVENDLDTNFDVHMPAEQGTQLTVSSEVLKPGHDYIFEVLAIEEGGNQTITEGCFSTAP
jgi:hypothetical protein